MKKRTLPEVESGLTVWISTIRSQFIAITTKTGIQNATAAVYTIFGCNITGGLPRKASRLLTKRSLQMDFRQKYGGRCGPPSSKLSRGSHDTVYTIENRNTVRPKLNANLLPIHTGKFFVTSLLICVDQVAFKKMLNFASCLIDGD